MVIGAVMLGCGAALLLPRTHFDFDPLNLKDPDTESVSTLFDLMDNRETAPYTITILADGLREAVALGSRLDALAPVREARTLADYVPSDQEEKLEIVDTMAMFLLPALMAPKEAPADAAALAGALEALKEKMAPLAAMDGQAAAARLAAALAKVAPDPAGLKALEESLVATLPGRLEVLRQSLEPGTVALEDLPEGLRGREMAADGRTRLTVYPVEDLRDNRALVKFVAAVRGLAPDATGSPVVILEAGRVVVAAFVQAGLTALALITLLMVVLLRGFREVALVFGPLALAALLTAAASVISGVPFNFANVIVLPLLFGLGVASGIHLVSRARDEEKNSDRAEIFKTSTPRAVVFSALTTIGSFGSIALSSHPGTASMGVLLTIAIALTLMCTLAVLPALMALWPASAKGEDRT